MTSEVILALIAILSNVVTWFLTRKKYNTEVDSNYIKNIEDGLKTYDDIIKHNRDEIKQLITEKNELRKEVDDLRKQVNDLLFNICLDLTCKRRIREAYAIKKLEKNGKKKSGFDQTESPCGGGSESPKEGGDTDNKG